MNDARHGGYDGRKKNGMNKWYIEYRAYCKLGYMRGIEAANGNEAIEILKSKVIGINKIIGVWHDDDGEQE